MRKDIKALIERVFPGKTYANPLDKGEALGPEQRQLIYDIIGELRHLLERDLGHSSDGQYDLSEKVVIKHWIVLRISFLGPFAYLDVHNAKRCLREEELDKVRRVIQETLAKYEVLILSDAEVQETVDWLEAGESVAGKVCRVWNCLFCEY